MKPGRTTTYLTEQLANLLEAHGPSGTSGRNLADKLNVIVPNWDRVMRDESSRWRSTLTRDEWKLLQKCTSEYTFGMEGGTITDDVGSVLRCLEDASAIDIDDAKLWGAVETALPKLKTATVAAQLALVWMLLRERRRTA